MKKNFFLFILIWMLIGCSSTQESHQPNISPLPTKIYPEMSPTFRLELTPTISTLIRTTSEIKSECITLSDSVPNNKPQGTFVFKKNWESRLSFFNNETNQEILVPSDATKHVDEEYFSSDRNWIVYKLDMGDPNGTTKFILTNATDTQPKDVSFNRFWINFSWLNNHALRVNDIDVASQSIQSFAFDPFTETQSALQSDFPGVLSDKSIDWFIDRQPIRLGMLKGTNIIYDPTLTRVLYPKSNGSISLYNLETNIEISQITFPNWGRFPEWSPDGKYLSIIGTRSSNPLHEDLDEFFLVSRDGPQFQQLTQLTSTFKSVHIERYSWSPDGQQIALWLKTEKTSSDNPANQYELAVLNLQTRQITTYCFMGTPEIEFDTYSRNADLIWSPGSEQLLMAQYTSKDKKNFRVLLVDFSENKAYQVAQNMYQVGWLTSQP